MNRRRKSKLLVLTVFTSVMAILSVPALAQLVDKTQTPNIANEGINKSLAQQIGAGRGSVTTPNSSLFIINRDPFRAIRRGRQLFQRKFTRRQGQGPLEGDGVIGDINSNLALGAGLADSCAACHGRPRGSAGFGGDVVTRPDSRDAPHLFGLGLKEMLADEITTDLRNIRAQAISQARSTASTVTRTLTSKGINYGTIRAFANGSVDTSGVRGVNPDLRVRPFFLQGGTISIREFAVGAFDAEMGLQPVDPDLTRAKAGNRVVTPSGMVLDGRIDEIEEAFNGDNTAGDEDGDGVTNEIPTSLIDFMEFYLLHYFKPATRNNGDDEIAPGRSLFVQIGCATCHIPDLTINRDRRVADVETTFAREDLVRSDGGRGNPFVRLFAVATPSFTAVNDGTGFPTLKRPRFGPFVVKNIYTDFKRHDLGPNFHEINYDGTLQRQFLTTPLWGVGSTAPYGHDGRSPTLQDVIRRHGGEAQTARDRFTLLSLADQERLIAFLNFLVLFPPDDTPSNLSPANPSAQGYPQFGHGSINLTTLFNNPNDIE
ncbi:MAG TPA: di-heme oxidoredictase family protein [Blastocatellia bacterium]|nr:di-heme oxidoredictase family protein [Blastocatellia bacterium]